MTTGFFGRGFNPSNGMSATVCPMGYAMSLRQGWIRNQGALMALLSALEFYK